MKRREEVDAIVGGLIKQRTLADAIGFFEEAEVTAAPVYDIGQFLDDPHVQERGIVVEAPDDEMGGVPMHAVVPRLRHPGPLRSPAPAIGQHNREVFARSATPTSASPRSPRKASSDHGRSPRPSLVADPAGQRASFRGEGLRPWCRRHRPRPRGLGAAQEKASARKLVQGSLAVAGRGGAEVLVRVNNDPALLTDDIDAAVHPGLDGLSIPKAETAAQIQAIVVQVERLERARGVAPGHLRLSLAIETPRGLLAWRDRRSSDRIATMSIGVEDYCLGWAGALRRRPRAHVPGRPARHRLQGRGSPAHRPGRQHRGVP